MDADFILHSWSRWLLRIVVSTSGSMSLYNFFFLTQCFPPHNIDCVTGFLFTNMAMFPHSTPHQSAAVYPPCFYHIKTISPATCLIVFSVPCITALSARLVSLLKMWHCTTAVRHARLLLLRLVRMQAGYNSNLKRTNSDICVKRTVTYVSNVQTVAHVPNGQWHMCQTDKQWRMCQTDKQ